MQAPEQRPDSCRPAPELISVVIPIRNAEEHIAGQLEAISRQTYGGPYEVVAVDNGCSDRSLAIVEQFRDRLPALLVVKARERRGLGRARNAGAAAARGTLLAYCDADDMVEAEWLAALANAAQRADIVGGRVLYDQLNSELQLAWERPQPMTTLRSGYAFLPYPSGGNCAIWADVAREVGWDESFAFGASDIEFGWRAQLAGFRVGFTPDAVIQRRFRNRPAAVARQHFRYGAAEPYLFRRFRDHGMPASDRREALEYWQWLLRNAVRDLRGADRQGNWLRLAAARTGRVYGSLRWRVLYL
jgi:glycosyltransferase involved in cell wall biosynthesis